MCNTYVTHKFDLLLNFYNITIQSLRFLHIFQMTNLMSSKLYKKLTTLQCFCPRQYIAVLSDLPLHLPNYFFFSLITSQVSQEKNTYLHYKRLKGRHIPLVQHYFPQLLPSLDFIHYVLKENFQDIYLKKKKKKKLPNLDKDLFHSFNGSFIQSHTSTVHLMCTNVWR